MQPISAHRPARVETTPVLLVKEGSETRTVYLADLSKNKILGHLKALATRPEKYAIGMVTVEIDDTPASDLVTVPEWVQERKLEVTPAQAQALAMQASAEYVKTYGRTPRTVARANDKGKFVHRARAYRRDDLHLLEEAWAKVEAGTVDYTSVFAQ